MTLTVTNAQRALPVDAPRMARMARAALKRLRLRGAGCMAITFVTGARMRALNRRFLGHDRSTDVLSFRYDDAAPRHRASAGRARSRVVGDIVVAPSEARTYAARHSLSYEEELSRYVLHGLLHWLGHEDATPAQQRRMRALEDALLARCRPGQAHRNGHPHH